MRQRGLVCLFVWPTITPPPIAILWSLPVNTSRGWLNPNKQINLSATTREIIIARQQRQQEAGATASKSSFHEQLAPPSVDLFAEAWDEVTKLLQRDAFAQFRNTNAFLQLKREWDEEVGLS